jgi:uncharacterized membrane protein YeiH
MTVSPIIEHAAIIVSALSGVLAARGKQLDLFGILVLAVVTSFGGGTVRDLLVGDVPVSWLKTPMFLHTALGTGFIAFYVCRFWQPPASLLLVADAFALALFTTLGARKGVDMGFSPSVAIMLGITTGVAGGIVRDTMLEQVPMVFRRNTYLYATAAACGGGVYLGLRALGSMTIDHAEI